MIYFRNLTYRGVVHSFIGIYVAACVLMCIFSTPVDVLWLGLGVFLSYVILMVPEVVSNWDKKLEKEHSDER